MNETLHEHYSKNFNNLVKKLSFRAGTQWDAEDAIHDAYERALKYFPSFNPDKATFGQWFNRILVNALKEHYSRNQGKNDLEFDEDQVEGTPCEHYPNKVREEIGRRIKERKPHITEVLSLYFEKGYGAKDISRMVESSHFAVNQMIFRFREELKELYR